MSQLGRLGWALALAIGCAMTGLLACNEVSPKKYVEIVERSRDCGSGDSCVLAGAGECTCALPVNARSEAEVNEAAQDVDCEGVVVTGDGGAPTRCGPQSNVRCEAGRCVSDESL